MGHRKSGLGAAATMRADTQILPPRYGSPNLVARGGMGDIFRATDDTLGRAVAIKVLGEHYAHDDSIRERFTREALAAARLSGEPNTVTIFDVGEWNGRPFIVMEYLSGGSLEERLSRGGAQPPGQALQWLEQAAAALDAAHREDVVHRDVKPANLLLDREGNVHVADFGIARAAGLQPLTLTGTVLGTAGYLSPEQALGDPASPASDRYSLAIVAFELLCGRRPFEGDSITAEAAAHVNAPVPSVVEVHEGVPVELDPVFRKALAKDPSKRFGTCAEFVGCLRDALSEAAGGTRTLRSPSVLTPVVRRRRRSFWPAVLGALALAGAAGALAAALLIRGGGQQARVATVTLGGTTLHETVTTTPTGSTTVASSVPSGLGGHALNDEGFRQIQAGNYSAALPLLQQAVQRLRGTGPGDSYEGYANYNLGYTLWKLGRCSEAVSYLERARELEPDRHEPKDVLKRARKC
ncbi:MAG: serine/threonine-protein kinase [Gaiellaceae bacterium]